MASNTYLCTSINHSKAFGHPANTYFILIIAFTFTPTPLTHTYTHIYTLRMERAHIYQVSAKGGTCGRLTGPILTCNPCTSRGYTETVFQLLFLHLCHWISLNCSFISSPLQLYPLQGQPRKAYSTCIFHIKSYHFLINIHYSVVMGANVPKTQWFI